VPGKPKLRFDRPGHQTVPKDQEADMNERTMRDRFHALGPLVLRAGIALILLHNGLQRTAVMFKQNTTPAVQTDTAALIEQTDTAAATQPVVAATPEGFRFDADWGLILGVGELAAAGLLLIGLGTRLVVLPVLAVLGFALFGASTQVPLPTNTTAMWLLVVACLSLLVSGGGSLAMRRRRRRALPPQAPVREQADQPREFVHARPPMTQRVRNWFARRRAALHPVQAAPAAPARRWRWGR
jgi:uncharacterized membrane protein YphA (DoxX/SURF4 family)